MNIQRIGGQLMPEGGHHDTPVPSICSAKALTRNWYSLPGSAQAQHWRPSGVKSSSFLSVARRHSQGVVVQEPGSAAQCRGAIFAVHVAPSSGRYTTEQNFARPTGISISSDPWPLRTPSTRRDAPGASALHASSLRRVMSSCSSAGAARIITCGTTVVSQRRAIVTQPYHTPSLSASHPGAGISSEAISTRGVRPCRTIAATPFRTSSPQATPSLHQHIRGPTCAGAPKASAEQRTSPSALISRIASPSILLKTSVPVHRQVLPPRAQTR
mmetsp:Transcript_46461/g.140980  ORF Transcript_46461/g.140980 Transcript_46461/m.140980 type:complete len:271 (-) Transcript_46461:70-882(-)